MRVRRFTMAVVSKQGILLHQHLIGQLTECAHDGLIFWVREAVDKRTQFTTSAGERMGQKTRAVAARRQALELCCPEEHWERIAALVHQADALRRPVLRSRRFTKAWIDKQWANDVLGGAPRQRASLSCDLALRE